jgi:DNA-binding GntR family transcriptional regulator
MPIHPSAIFAPIEPRSMSQEIVDSLRQAIVSGQVEFGQHLTEASLSEQMKVSRIPIREALRQLEQEGILARYNNRGCFVITFSDQDVREVFSLRATLEGMSIQWAAPHLSGDDLQELRELIERQQGAVAARDYALLARLDMHFHEFLCLKAGHSRLLKDWYALHAQTQMLLNRRFARLPDYTPETVVEDHRCILKAIESGDWGLAIRLTHEISERVQEECIEMLHRAPAPSPAPDFTLISSGKFNEPRHE